MIEPGQFYANPETMATNAYQIAHQDPITDVTAKAIEEFRAFRDELVHWGVIVTCAKGRQNSPDMVFPNWFFAPPSREFILCPMLNKSRQDERTPMLVDLLQKLYPNHHDWTHYEAEGRALESTASIVSDHVNKRCYSALSPRTDEALAREWAAFMGYDIFTFNSASHKGIPVYHTDCLMWIGTSLAGLCVDAIVESDRARILGELKSTHEVVEFDEAQLRAFCGNALEVVNRKGQKLLAISEGALQALRPDQLEKVGQHFDGIVSSPLPTLEKYGGGSARCMLAELF
jgi:hypothetical protein